MTDHNTLKREGGLRRTEAPKMQEWTMQDSAMTDEVV